MNLSPLTQRRLANFKANRRGWWSLWIFLALFFLTLGAELIANERPLLLSFQNELYAPILQTYPETTFGGEFETETDYRDPYIRRLIEKDGWMIFPLIEFDYTTINYDSTKPAPNAPNRENWLGTDDQGRDVLARVIYGFRIRLSSDSF